jgi:hypothetical protein
MYYPYFPTPNPAQQLSPWLRQQQSSSLMQPSIPDSAPQYPSGTTYTGEESQNQGLDLPQAQPDSFPNPAPTAPVSSAAPAEAPDSPLMAMYKRLLNQPEGAAHSAYTAYLNKGYPQESQYQPSKWRSLLGMATSGLLSYARDPNALAKGKEITDEPYRRAIAQYGAEGQRLYQAANEEDRQAQNDIRNVTGMVAEKRAADLAQHQRNQDTIAETKAASLERHRLAVEALDRIKVNKPDVHYFTQKGGHVWAVDAKDLAHPVDTGIDSGTLSDSDKIAYNLSSSLEEIAARIKGAKEVKATASGTARKQIVQPVDEKGNPIGKSFVLNLDTMQKEEIPMEGFTKGGPKPPSEGTETETTTERETPPPEPGLIRKGAEALGYPAEKPKVVITKTQKSTTPPSKKSQSDEGKSKTKVPADQENKGGTNNPDGTTENYVVKVDRNGDSHKVAPKDMAKYLEWEKTLKPKTVK